MIVYSIKLFSLRKYYESMIKMLQQYNFKGAPNMHPLTKGPTMDLLG